MARELDPESRGIILRSLVSGLPRYKAAAVAGVSRDTFAGWLKRYPEFALEVEKAESKFLSDGLVALGKIVALGVEDAKASNAAVNALKFLLERRFREDYGQRIEHKVEAVESLDDAYKRGILALDRLEDDGDSDGAAAETAVIPYDPDGT